MNSVHEKLARVRKPRVHITYDVETEGAAIVRELPFVVGVMGDYAGDPTEPVKPFAERKFVATPLAIGLRIGGAAEFAGLEAPPNYRRSDALLQLARRYLPGLDESGAQKWMGHRPATPDSLPVIGASGTSPRVFYAFGHGHLGLTQSVTTGELIGELLAGVTSSIDLAPYAITRF